MRPAGMIGTAAVLAVGLFVLGGLGLLRGEPEPEAPAASNGSVPALLGPAPAGNLDRTIADLQARLRAIEGDWRGYAGLGLAYLQKARVSADPTYYSKAEGALRRSLEIQRSDNADALMGMGSLALARHDFTSALRWGRRAHAENPDAALPLGVIGDALVELGRYRQAVDAFQRMVDTRPDLSSYARVSYARELHGDVAGARRAMSLALDAAGGAPTDAAWVSYQLGELAWNRGDLRAAAREYRRGDALAPDDALPRAGLARVAAARGDFDRAIKILAPVARRFPAPELVILLGDLYGAAGRTERQVEQYELVRAIDDLYRTGGVNTDLEMALFDADHGVEPEATLARARAEYARRPSIHAADVLAWALHGAGRHREAERYAQRALRLGTPNALFRYHAGMIALELGKPAEARRHLRAALELNPRFSFLHAPRAREALRSLGGTA